MTGFPTLPQEHRTRSALLGVLVLAVLGLGLWYSGVFNCSTGCGAAVEAPCSAAQAEASPETPTQAPCPYSAAEGVAETAEEVTNVKAPAAAEGDDPAAYEGSPCSASLGLWEPEMTGSDAVEAEASVKAAAAE